MVVNGPGAWGKGENGSESITTLENNACDLCLGICKLGLKRTSYRYVNWQGLSGGQFASMSELQMHVSLDLAIILLGIYPKEWG